MSKTVSIKVLSDEKTRFKAVASARKVPFSDLIAKDLESLWARGGSGISDLFSNKMHMRGFGESRYRQTVGEIQ